MGVKEVGRMSTILHYSNYWLPQQPSLPSNKHLNLQTSPSLHSTHRMLHQDTASLQPSLLLLLPVSPPSSSLQQHSSKLLCSLPPVLPLLSPRDLQQRRVAKMSS
ncbi:hypothetical protein GWK47_021577 [Chionoecetes opilio]|uniref:Uncharacterized protein n=1 Tax=Chionoecetes opilio TaxID=41210 RepID=A0A8J4XPC3_CHIOP|nr:hypothetical protein GWK47_021577 [Chionoecetes opilio]